jgi:hypothetical protein
MLTAQTATTPKLLIRPSQNTKDTQLACADEIALSDFSGESPETLQFFAELHRSEQFTETAVLKHFAGMAQPK